MKYGVLFIICMLLLGVNLILGDGEALVKAISAVVQAIFFAAIYSLYLAFKRRAEIWQWLKGLSDGSYLQQMKYYGSNHRTTQEKRKSNSTTRFQPSTSLPIKTDSGKMNLKRLQLVVSLMAAIGIGYPMLNVLSDRSDAINREYFEFKIWKLFQEHPPVIDDSDQDKDNSKKPIAPAPGRQNYFHYEDIDKTVDRLLFLSDEHLAKKSADLSYSPQSIERRLVFKWGEFDSGWREYRKRAEEYGGYPSLIAGIGLELLKILGLILLLAALSWVSGYLIVRSIPQGVSAFWRWLHSQ